MTIEQLAAYLHSIIDDDDSGIFTGGFIAPYDADDSWTMLEGQINFKALALKLVQANLIKLTP